MKVVRIVKVMQGDFKASYSRIVNQYFSNLKFIRFSYLFGSVLTVLLKIRYLKLFYGIFVYYGLLKFRLNTIFCQFLKARVFFLVRLPPLAVLDSACFQNQHIPFLNSSVHR